MTDEQRTQSPYVTVKVPRALYDDVVKIADKNRRSLMGEVAFVLEQHIEANRHLLPASDGSGS